MKPEALTLLIDMSSTDLYSFPEVPAPPAPPPPVSPNHSPTLRRKKSSTTTDLQSRLISKGKELRKVSKEKKRSIHHGSGMVGALARALEKRKAAFKDDGKYNLIKVKGVLMIVISLRTILNGFSKRHLKEYQFRIFVRLMAIILNQTCRTNYP